MADDGTTLEPIKSEHAVIREMKTMRKRGSSCRTIAGELTGRGVPTKKGNATWTHQAVASILKRALASTDCGLGASTRTHRSRMQATGARGLHRGFSSPATRELPHSIHGCSKCFEGALRERDDRGVGLCQPGGHLVYREPLQKTQLNDVAVGI